MSEVRVDENCEKRKLVEGWGLYSEDTQIKIYTNNTTKNIKIYLYNINNLFYVNQ